MKTIPENKPGVENAEGSIPAARTTPSKPNPDTLLFTPDQLQRRAASKTEFRPQSSPTTVRLTKRDLRDLMRLCDVEIGHCGLDQEAGRRAAELKEKLAVIHRQP